MDNIKEFIRHGITGADEHLSLPALLLPDTEMQILAVGKQLIEYIGKAELTRRRNTNSRKHNVIRHMHAAVIFNNFAFTLTRVFKLDQTRKYVAAECADMTCGRSSSCRESHTQAPSVN